MERRKVLKTSLAFLGTTALVTLGYPLARYVNPPKAAISASKLTIDKEEIPPGTAKEIILQGTPVIVINRNDGGYIAMSRVCTHLGCLIGYDRYKNRLVCPCHAGAFDLEGQVTSGPPSKPLRSYPIKVASKQITIG